LVSWKDLKHITKLDPDKKNTPDIIKTAVESNTDALMISGTQGITKSNVKTLFKTLKDSTDKPILLEPVHKSSILYDVDYIYIPIVLNTENMLWIQGLHLEWLKDLIEKSSNLPWDRIITEGYIILNPESTVSKVTQAKTALTKTQIASFTLYGQLLGLDSIYLEYSGTFGNPDVLKHMRKYVSKSRLFYGGGIENKDQSEKMLEYADTIFVGNIIYRNFDAYIDTIP
jgi:phosphoglycerol geranylgeranyltransferase